MEETFAEIGLQRRRRGDAAAGRPALTSRWRPLKTTAKAPWPMRSLRENSNLPTASRPPPPPPRGSIAAGRLAQAGRGPGDPGRMAGGPARPGPVRSGPVAIGGGRGLTRPCPSVRPSVRHSARLGSARFAAGPAGYARPRRRLRLRLRLGLRRANKRVAAAGPSQRRRRMRGAAGAGPGPVVGGVCPWAGSRRWGGANRGRDWARGRALGEGAWACPWAWLVWSGCNLPLL